MNAQRPLDISVILCAYTEARWNDLLAAVESVQRQTLPPSEVILVIDHNPALFQRAREQFPGLMVLENQGQRGESGGRNTGVSVARGTIVAFLDEDATAEPDWLEKLAGHYVDPNVLGVGGFLEPHWLDHKPGWFPDEFNWVIGCSYRGLPQTAAQVRNLIGANMSFRHSVFDELGGFRSELGRTGTMPLADAETEFCVRVGQRWPQGALIYEPAAKARHRVPPQRARWSYFRARCYAEGLGKARMSEFVGTKDGLSTERAYTFRTLPAGVLRGLADAVLQLDFAGLGRAAAIVAGLAFTVAGYVIYKVQAKVSGRRTMRPSSHEPSEVHSDHRPVQVSASGSRGDVL